MESETKTKFQNQNQNDTYSFDLQNINFSLDSLLLLVVCSPVWLARAIFNERNFRSRRGRGGRRDRFSGSRRTGYVAGRGSRFFALRILGGSSFGFGGGSHGRGIKEEDTGTEDRYSPELYTFAFATWRNMK
jgi:hypothetical protein